jgi:hypothetical protein
MVNIPEDAFMSMMLSPEDRGGGKHDDDGDNGVGGGGGGRGGGCGDSEDYSEGLTVKPMQCCPRKRLLLSQQRMREALVE